MPGVPIPGTKHKRYSRLLPHENNARFFSLMAQKVEEVKQRRNLHRRIKNLHRRIKPAAA